MDWLANVMACCAEQTIQKASTLDLLGEILVFYQSVTLANNMALHSLSS